MRPDEDSPYMLLVAPVRDEIRSSLPAGYEQAFGIDKLNYRRSTIPAITHVDYSARVQTVDAARNPLFHKLLTKFHEKTGCAVLINTSFNVRGEPIVCTPQDAFRCFRGTNIDVLVLGRQILLKDDQPQLDGQAREEYLAQFKLD
jgi:carbamoyltransferase